MSHEDGRSGDGQQSFYGTQPGGGASGDGQPAGPAQTIIVTPPDTDANMAENPWYEGTSSDPDQTPGNGNPSVTAPAAATGSIPAAFSTFVAALPGSFTQAMEAATVNGVGWQPQVLAANAQPNMTSPTPEMLFADFNTPQSTPLMLFGTQPVGLVDASSVAMTVNDSAAAPQYIATGTGGMTLFTSAASGDFVAQGGTNTVVMGNGQFQGWNFDLLGGNNQVWLTGGADTVQTASGSTNLVAFGTGNDLAQSSGNDLFIASTGSDTIQAIGNNVTALGGTSGTLTYTGAASISAGGSQGALIFGRTGGLNVQGGAGSDTVVTGSGGGMVVGGSAGRNLLVGGASGAATLIGGGNGDTLIGGAGDSVVASSGNETLVSSSAGNNTLQAGTGNAVVVLNGGNNTVMGGSAGTDVIWAGAGNSVINTEAANVMLVGGAGNTSVTAGSGMDIFAFVNGQAGGSMTINNFNTATDSINLVGYGANTASVASSGGSTTITLADKTQIQLVGIASLPAAAIT